MRQRRVLFFVLSLFVLAAAFAACKKSEPPPPAAPVPAAPAPFAVSGVDLGKQIGADKRVSAPVAVFAAGDTIYASVISTGASPSVTLKARWTFEDGQLVNEAAQSIAPSGPAVTEFHIAKASGWPTGKYKVEIAANDAVVGSKEFEVR